MVKRGQTAVNHGRWRTWAGRTIHIGRSWLTMAADPHRALRGPLTAARRMTAQLLLDDPCWPYPAPHGGVARRHLRVFRTAPGRVSAVLTEAGPGPNIGVCAAAIAAKLAAEWPDDVMNHIQHWPATGTRGAHFVAVEVPTAGEPRWHYLTAEQVTGQLGVAFAVAPIGRGPSAE